MGKTAVVLGATGLVGSSLVQELAASDHIDRVIALSRRLVEYESAKVSSELVDFDDLSKSSDIIRGDFLFSCLGTTLKKAGSVEAQRKVDVDYQYQVAELASKNCIGHYFLVSSSGADSSSRSSYLKMKGDLEEMVKALDFQSITILQPSLLLGERDHFRLAETFGAYVLPALCRLPFLKKYRPIQGEQVAKKMLDLSKSENSGVEVYTRDVTDKHGLSLTNTLVQ